MARTGGYGDKKLSKEEVKNLQKKENQIQFGQMILGFIKNFIPLSIKLIEMLVGILIGKGLNHVNLQNILKVNFTIWHCDGWGQTLSKDKKEIHPMVKLEKLSVTVTLSDPKDYKGGELEFDFRNFRSR